MQNLTDEAGMKPSLRIESLEDYLTLAEQLQARKERLPAEIVPNGQFVEFINALLNRGHISYMLAVEDAEDYGSLGINQGYSTALLEKGTGLMWISELVNMLCIKRTPPQFADEHMTKALQQLELESMLAGKMPLKVEYDLASGQFSFSEKAL